MMSASAPDPTDDASTPPAPNRDDVVPTSPAPRVADDAVAIPYTSDLADDAVPTPPAPRLADDAVAISPVPKLADDAVAIPCTSDLADSAVSTPPAPMLADDAVSTPPAPIPADAKPAPPAPPARPPRPAPRASLAAPLVSLDGFLTHLHRCLSTPSGVDTVLLFLCYSSRLASSALRPRRRGAAAARLLALSAMLSEARTISRLWGLLGLYQWGRGLVLQQLRRRRQQQERRGAGGDGAGGDGAGGDGAGGALPPPPSTLAAAQLAACVAFQVLENGAYLSSRGVLGWGPQARARAYLWSSRFWAVYVATELGRLAAEGVGMAAGAAAATVGDAGVWRRELARNLAWAPLTVHWGTEMGVVADWMIGALGSVPGLIQMRQLWKETA